MALTLRLSQLTWIRSKGCGCKNQKPRRQWSRSRWTILPVLLPLLRLQLLPLLKMLHLLRSVVVAAPCAHRIEYCPIKFILYIWLTYKRLDYFFREWKADRCSFERKKKICKRNSVRLFNHFFENFFFRSRWSTEAEQELIHQRQLSKCKAFGVVPQRRKALSEARKQKQTKQH